MLVISPDLQTGMTATVSSENDKLRIDLIQDGRSVGSIEIPSNQACNAAAILLMAAKDSHERRGSPPLPDIRPKEAYANLPPSGLNLGPSHMPNSDSLIFYFEETALAMSIPRSLATEVGQRLVTLGATGTAQ